MKLKYLFKISIKNLLANRLRTFLTIGGVTIGIGSIVFLVSLGFGLQRLVTSEVATMEEMSIIDITPGESEILKLDQENIDRIKDIADIEQVAPMINVAARVYYQASAIDGVGYGVGQEYLDISLVKVEKGELLSSDEAEEVIVNRAILNLLGVKENQEAIIGQNFKFDLIATADLLEDGKKKEIKDMELRVVGIHSSEDTPCVYLPIGLLEKEGIVYHSSLKAKMVDRHKVEGTREAIENMGFKTEYVGDTITQINQIFNIFKVALASFGAVAMIVAALGMFNTLTVSLLERIREVGLLKALGMKGEDIRRLFLSEALIIGIGGGVLGLIFGYLVGLLLNFTLNLIAQASGAESVSFFYMPWYFALGVALFAVFVGVVTGLYPAKRAVKINALDALRYE